MIYRDSEVKPYILSDCYENRDFFSGKDAKAQNRIRSRVQEQESPALAGLLLILFAPLPEVSFRYFFGFSGFSGFPGFPGLLRKISNTDPVSIETTNRFPFGPV